MLDTVRSKTQRCVQLKPENNQQYDKDMLGDDNTVHTQPKPVQLWGKWGQGGSGGCGACRGSAISVVNMLDC